MINFTLASLPLSVWLEINAYVQKEGHLFFLLPLSRNFALQGLHALLAETEYYERANNNFMQMQIIENNWRLIANQLFLLFLTLRLKKPERSSHLYHHYLSSIEQYLNVTTLIFQTKRLHMSSNAMITLKSLDTALRMEFDYPIEKQAYQRLLHLSELPGYRVLGNLALLSTSTEETRRSHLTRYIKDPKKLFYTEKNLWKLFINDLSEDNAQALFSFLVNNVVDYYIGTPEKQVIHALTLLASRRPDLCTNLKSLALLEKTIALLEQHLLPLLEALFNQKAHDSLFLETLEQSFTTEISSSYKTLAMSRVLKPPYLNSNHITRILETLLHSPNKKHIYIEAITDGLVSLSRTIPTLFQQEQLSLLLPFLNVNNEYPNEIRYRFLKIITNLSAQNPTMIELMFNEIYALVSAWILNCKGHTYNFFYAGMDPFHLSKELLGAFGALIIQNQGKNQMIIHAIADQWKTFLGQKANVPSSHLPYDVARPTAFLNLSMILKEITTYYPSVIDFNENPALFLLSLNKSYLNDNDRIVVSLLKNALGNIAHFNPKSKVFIMESISSKIKEQPEDSNDFDYYFSLKNLMTFLLPEAIKSGLQSHCLEAFRAHLPKRSTWIPHSMWLALAKAQPEILAEEFINVMAGYCSWGVLYEVKAVLLTLGQFHVSCPSLLRPKLMAVIKDIYPTSTNYKFMSDDFKNEMRKRFFQTLTIIAQSEPIYFKDNYFERLISYFQENNYHSQLGSLYVLKEFIKEDAIKPHIPLILDTVFDVNFWRKLDRRYRRDTTLQQHAPLRNFLELSYFFISHFSLALNKEKVQAFCEALYKLEPYLFYEFLAKTYPYLSPFLDEKFRLAIRDIIQDKHGELLESIKSITASDLREKAAIKVYFSIELSNLGVAEKSCIPQDEPDKQAKGKEHNNPISNLFFFPMPKDAHEEAFNVKTRSPSTLNP